MPILSHKMMKISNAFSRNKSYVCNIKKLSLIFYYKTRAGFFNKSIYISKIMY